MNNSSYQKWKKARLESCPQSVEELLVDIGGLVNLSEAEKAEIQDVLRRSNMAVYRCRDNFVDRAAVCAFAANFGLRRLLRVKGHGPGMYLTPAVA